MYYECKHNRTPPNGITGYYDFKITGHLKLKSSEYDSCVVLFQTDQIRSRHNIPHVSDYCGVQLICAVFTIKTTIELLTVLQIGNY